MKTLLEKIDLAIKANGGEDWRSDYCQCDAVVGYTLCEYCAIHSALRDSKRLVSNVLTMINDPYKRIVE